MRCEVLADDSSDDTSGREEMYELQKRWKPVLRRLRKVCSLQSGSSNEVVLQNPVREVQTFLRGYVCQDFQVKA